MLRIRRRLRIIVRQHSRCNESQAIAGIHERALQRRDQKS